MVMISELRYEGRILTMRDSLRDAQGVFSDRVMLQDRREHLFRSQEDLATELGISIATYRAWEASPTKPAIPQSVLDGLAKVEREWNKPGGCLERTPLYTRPNISNKITDRRREWICQHPGELVPPELDRPNTYPEDDQR